MREGLAKTPVPRFQPMVEGEGSWAICSAMLNKTPCNRET